MGRFSRKHKEPPRTSPQISKDGAVSDPAAGPPQQQPPSLYDGPRASEASMDKTKQVQKETDEVAGIMHQNVDKMLERGEALGDLNKKTEDLQVSSNQFAKHSAAVKKKLWWKNVKMGIIVASVLLVLIIGGVAYGVISSKKKKD